VLNSSRQLATAALSPSALRVQSASASPHAATALASAWLARLTSAWVAAGGQSRQPAALPNTLTSTSAAL